MVARACGFAKRHAGVGFVLLAVLVLFREAILFGRVFYENDTIIFYYPVMATWTQWLARGELLLWTPHVFGGFPLFADGEAGMLYPINLLLLRLLPFAQAFAWLSILHFALAALFTYLYVRLLVPSALAATIAALSFSLGGFMVAQVHHTSISSGLAWLPVIFFLIEKAFLGKGAKRYRWLLLAAVAFAMQLLTVHPQVPLLTGFALAFYVPFRAFSAGEHGPLSLARVWEGASTAAIALGIIGLAGAGLAAMQVFPTYELGSFSLRSGGTAYEYAIEYSQPIFNLITLLFPYFFRHLNGYDWGLWAGWENAIYVGVTPLVLATIGALRGGRRHKWFFVFLAIVSLIISFADYSPLNLHWWLHEVPGFSQMRAPGRFAALFGFALSILAGLGAAAVEAQLCSRTLQGARDRSEGERVPYVEAYGTRTVPRRLKPAATLCAFSLEDTSHLRLIVAIWGIIAVALPALLIWAKRFVDANPELVRLGIAQLYLTPMRMDRLLNAERVYTYLAYSLDLRLNSRTLFGCIVLLATVALLAIWLRWRRPWKLWCAGLLLLTVADLLVFGSKYHSTIDTGEILARSPALEFLARDDGLHRIQSRYIPLDQPDRLLPLGLSTVAGYSSLENKRHAELDAALDPFGNRSLDLWNVRYIWLKIGDVLPGQRMQQFTRYNPDRGIVQGLRQESPVVFRFPEESPLTVGQIRVVSRLQNAAHIPQGATVGEVRLRSSTGERRVVPIQAGVHTAEWAMERADVRPLMQHRQPTVAFKKQEQGFEGYYYFAILDVDVPAEATGMEIAYTFPTGAMDIFGLAVVDAVDGRVFQLDRFDSAEFRTVYRDSYSVIYENQAYLPRAFLVPSAQILAGDRVLGVMAKEDFDIRSTVALEDVDPAQASRFNAAPMTDDDVVSVDSYESTWVVLRVAAKQDRYLVLTDTFYPGWRAFVDGQETPIYRADYLFRAIAIPPGEHEVVFAFAPDSVRFGAYVSVGFWIMVVGALGVLSMRVQGSRCH